MDDSVNLDVHAINELKVKGQPPTQDQPKYDYSADEEGAYSELLHVIANVYLHIL